MFVSVEKFCPFMCSLSYLSDGTVNFKDIKKRKLMDQFNFSNESLFNMSQYTTLVSDATNPSKLQISQKKWGVQQSQLTSLGKTLLKMSIQDMHLLFQICSYMAETLTLDLVSKLKHIWRQININDQLQIQKQIENLQQTSSMAPIIEREDEYNELSPVKRKRATSSDDDQILFNQNSPVKIDGTQQSPKQLRKQPTKQKIKSGSSSYSSVISSSNMSQTSDNQESTKTKTRQLPVDEALIDSLHQKLNKAFDASMGSQVSRLGTMMGLFGQLTEQYTTRKLRKRNQFEKFVNRNILQDVLNISNASTQSQIEDSDQEPREETKEQNQPNSYSSGLDTDPQFDTSYKRISPKGDPHQYSALLKTKKEIGQQEDLSEQDDNRPILLGNKKPYGSSFKAKRGLQVQTSLSPNRIRKSTQYQGKSSRSILKDNAIDSDNSDDFKSAHMYDDDEDEFVDALDGSQPVDTGFDYIQDQMVSRERRESSKKRASTFQSRRPSQFKQPQQGKNKQIKDLNKNEDDGFVHTRRLSKYTGRISNTLIADGHLNGNDPLTTEGIYRTQSAGLVDSIVERAGSISSKRKSTKRQSLTAIQMKKAHQKRSVMENLRAFEQKVTCQNFSFLFINDFDRCFTPVIEFSIQHLKMNTESSCDQKLAGHSMGTQQQVSETREMTSSKMELTMKDITSDYYNLELGIWEPFLEQLTVNLNKVENPTQSEFILNLPGNTNLNISESCMRNIILTYQSWMSMPSFYQNSQKASNNMKSDKVSRRNKDFNNSDVSSSQVSNTSLQKSSDSEEEENKYEQENIHGRDSAFFKDSQDKQYNQNPLNLSALKPQNKEDNSTEAVTPFTLSNQTDLQIVIVSNGLMDEKTKAAKLAASVVVNNYGHLSNPINNNHFSQNRLQSEMIQTQIYEETKDDKKSWRNTDNQLLTNPNLSIIQEGQTEYSANDAQKANKQTSIFKQRTYKLTPGESQDYTVRYEKLIKEEYDRQKKKAGNGKNSQVFENSDDNNSESDLQSQAADFQEQEEQEAERLEEALQAQMKLRKRAEKVGIYINRINTVQQVDLDELSFDNPYVHYIKTKDKAKKPSEKKATSFNNSADLEVPFLDGQNTERDTNSFIHHQAAPDKKRRNKKLTRIKNLPQKDQDNLYLMKNIFLYGVVLRKMRKEFIIRTPCVFHNKTSYTYELLITNVITKGTALQFKIAPEQSYPLNTDYYKGHELRVRMLNLSPQLKKEEKLKLGRRDSDAVAFDMVKSTLGAFIKNVKEDTKDEGLFSEPKLISTLLKLEQNSGQGYFLTGRHKVKENDQMGRSFRKQRSTLKTFSTAIKRQTSDLIGCTDLVLLPSLMIKNCLPCSIMIKATEEETTDLSSLVTDQLIDENQLRFKVDKSEEKSFYVCSDLANNPGEMHLEVHVDGFQMQIIELNIADHDHRFVDKDVIIQDLNGNELKIGMRISLHKAGFHLTFFSHAVILIETRQLMHMGFLHLNYCSAILKNQLGQLAGSREVSKRGYVMANREDNINIGISPDTKEQQPRIFTSEPLEIKQTGVSKTFSIETSNVSNIKLRGKSTHTVINQKFNFVMSSHLHLCTNTDSIYTNVVSIKPKYVLVNSSKCALEISQLNCANIQTHLLDKGERLEWNWIEASVAELIIIRQATQSTINAKRMDLSSSAPFEKFLSNSDRSQKIVTSRDTLVNGSEQPDESHSDNDVDPENLLIPDRNYTVQLDRKWFWSSGFGLASENQQMTVLIREDNKDPLLAGRRRNKDDGLGNLTSDIARKKIIKITRKIIQDTVFINFEEEDEAAPMFQIQNKCNNVTIKYAQVIPENTKFENTEQDYQRAEASQSFGYHKRQEMVAEKEAQNQHLSEMVDSEANRVSDKLGPDSESMFAFTQPQLSVLKLKVSLRTNTWIPPPGQQIEEYQSPNVKQELKWDEQEICVTFREKHANIVKITDQVDINKTNSVKIESIVLDYVDKLGIKRYLNARYENNGITKTLVFENQVDQERNQEEKFNQNQNQQAQNQLDVNYIRESGDLEIDIPYEHSRNTSSRNSSSINSSDRNSSDEEGFGMHEERKQKFQTTPEPKKNNQLITPEKPSLSRRRSGKQGQATQKSKSRSSNKTTPERLLGSDENSDTHALKTKNQRDKSPVIDGKHSVFQVKVNSINLSIVGGSFYDIKSDLKSKKGARGAYEDNVLLQEQMNVRTMITNRKELALVNIVGLDLDIETIPIQQQKSVKFSIAHLQIDDQSVLNPLYQTIFQPKSYYNYWRKNTKKFFEVSYTTRTDMQKVVFCNSFRFQVAESLFTADDDFLLNTAFLMIRISDLVGTTFTSVHPLFLKNSFYDDLTEIQPTEPPMRGMPMTMRPDITSTQSSSKGMKRKATLPNKKDDYGVYLESENICPTDQKELPAIFHRWMRQEVIDTSNRLVLHDFIIEPIFLDFSFVFKTRPTGGSQNLDAIGPLAYLKKTGFSVINVDEAIIRLPRQSHKLLVVSQDELQAQLSSEYKGLMIQEMKKIVFSIGLLGSPRIFYERITNGTNDLIDKPIEGFQEGGFLRGFRGFGAGTISFTKNLGVGMIQTGQTFTRSLSQLLITITTDRDYARSREENALTEKPKDFVEGFGFGSRAAITGFAAGISGIFTRPFHKARNEGVIGFFKGSYQGITGAVFKPVSGILDMFSKTAEGCKNTLLVFERKTSFSRTRQPRPFYGYKNVIKKFNPSHALLTNNILFELQQGEFQHNHFLELKLILPHLLMLTEEHLFLIESTQKVLVWYIPTHLIMKSSQLSNGLLIQLSAKHQNRDYFGLPLEKEIDAVLVMQWLNAIANEFNQ